MKRTNIMPMRSRARLPRHSAGFIPRIAALIPIPGRHMVYNALAGTAVGCTYGLTLEQIKQGIETLQPVSGRFHIIETGKYTVVDDCYNANPVSMKASLDVLKEAKGRKSAPLGDMGELGTDEAALHAEVGTHAGTCGIDALYCADRSASILQKRQKRQTETGNPPLRRPRKPDGRTAETLTGRGSDSGKGIALYGVWKDCGDALRREIRV